MNRDEVLAVLDSDPRGLIGQPESQALDFKGAPYRLAEQRERYELAKDIAAFANRDGGIIVVGVETSLASDNARESAKRLRPFARDLADLNVYGAVVQSRIYPEPSGIAFRFVEAGDEANRGLLVIDVPPQDEAMYPFLVKEPLPNDDEATPGWLVALPTRRIDQTNHITISELHRRIRDGASTPVLSTVLESLARIEDSMGSCRASPTHGDPTQEERLLETRIAGRVDATLDELRESGDSDTSLPYLYIAAAADQGRIDEFLRPDGVRALIENPPFTRAAGWNLLTHDTARMIDGPRLRVSNGSRKHIDISRDGTMIATAELPGFLARGGPHERWMLISLALIEFTYDFLAAYNQLAQHWLTPIPTRFAFRFGLRAAHWGDGHDYKLAFFPYRIDPSIGPLPTLIYAPQEMFDFETTRPAIDEGTGGGFDVAAVAYELVEAVYTWFAVTDAIPYSADRVIHPELFAPSI